MKLKIFYKYTEGVNLFLLIFSLWMAGLCIFMTYRYSKLSKSIEQIHNEYNYMHIGQLDE